LLTGWQRLLWHFVELKNWNDHLQLPLCLSFPRMQQQEAVVVLLAQRQAAAAGELAQQLVLAEVV
jgi:hypothetical protein